MEMFSQFIRTFLCGGILCLIGQILIDKTSLTPAKIDLNALRGWRRCSGRRRRL